MFLPGLWKLVDWRAFGALNRGFPDRALRIAEAFAKKRPSDPHAWLLLGRLLIRLDRVNEATPAFRKALAAPPHIPEASYWSAEILISIGAFEEADEILKEGLRQHPTAPWPYIGIAHLHFSREEWGDFSRHIAEATRLCGSDSEASMRTAMMLADRSYRPTFVGALLRDTLRVGSRDPFKHLLSALKLEEENSTSAKRHMMRARRYWRGPERFDDAERRLRAALDFASVHHPRRRPAKRITRFVWRHAMRMAKRGRPDRGVRLALWYVRIRPADPHAWLLVGQLLIPQGLFEEAADVLRIGLTRHSDWPEMWYWLSDAFQGAERLDLSAQVLQEGKDEHPRSAWIPLGLSSLAQIEGRYEDAVKHAKEAARLRGEDWEVATLAGQILMWLPEGQELAEELLREAAQWDTRDRFAHLLLGAFLEERNPAESAEYLRAAREVRPTGEFNNGLEQIRASMRRKNKGPTSGT